MWMLVEAKEELVAMVETVLKECQDMMDRMQINLMKVMMEEMEGQVVSVELEQMEHQEEMEEL